VRQNARWCVIPGGVVVGAYLSPMHPLASSGVLDHKMGIRLEEQRMAMIQKRPSQCPGLSEQVRPSQDNGSKCLAFGLPTPQVQAISNPARACEASDQWRKSPNCWRAITRSSS
jgi:hypothetical protein